MNQKFVHFLKNFMHALSANVIRLGISVVLTLLLPKLLGVDDYSYWQLYLFYGTYAAYSSMGWCEGTYLKYGGKEYDTLNPSVMSGQFWILAGFQALLCTGIGVVLFLGYNDPVKRVILTLAFVSSMFDILRYQLQNILQATNRIVEYARVVTIDRILFFVLIMFAVLSGARDYHYLIAAEILARICSMIYAIYLCRRVVFARWQGVSAAYTEAKELVSSGFKLLIATLASQLVIGIVRFCIDNYWGTVVFGKVSLTLSLSNMVITCIGAVSVVLFPVLKKMDSEKLKELYGAMRMVLTVPVLAVLILYAPMKAILVMWLPQYGDSLQYLAVLLPLCIYETRSFALINTYLKAYRKENLILLSNVVTVGFSAVLAFVCVYVLHNLDLTIVCIVVLVAFKSIYQEWLLSPFVSFAMWKDTVYESLMTVVFMAGSWFLPGGYATGLYLLAYLIYLFVKRKDLQKQLVTVKKIVRK